VKRAAVLIGVNQTGGGLPELKAAARSAVETRDWARQQGMDTELVIDSAGPVEPGMILAAVEKFVLVKDTEPRYEQLLVYFAGHGVNLRYGEYWLLSKAPTNTQAAVNVQGSALLARYCGIRHVVFISDACRTAADSVRAQFVTGSDIFPNVDPDGLESPVDLFYACTLGRPAYEVRNPKTAADRFNAAYTSALLSALDGRVDAAVDWESEERKRGHVRMRKLKQALAQKVPAMLMEAGVANEVFQQPDARIESEDAAWIAELPPARDPAKTYRSGRGTRLPESPPEPAREAFTWMMLRSGLQHADRAGSGPAAAAPAPSARLLAQAGEIADAARSSTAGGDSFDVRGTTIAGAWPQAGSVERSGPGSVRIVAPQADPRATCVLIEFGTGGLVLLPAIPGYRATLAVDKLGDLVDIAWERAAAAGGPGDAGLEAARQLRSLAAVASLDGPFHLDEAQAAQLAGTAQAAGPVDPALALYAAYADSGRGGRARAAAWDAAMRRDFGFTWPDLVLLASRPGAAAQAWEAAPLALPFPARAGGWALLDALGVRLAPFLASLQAHLTQSPWTLFSPGAAPTLLQLINGESS
jgi:hypothetical protein